MKVISFIVLIYTCLLFEQVLMECCYGTSISCKGKGRCNLFCCSCNGGCGMLL